eukprot:304643-Prymnesium_polylepis.2
MPHNGGPSTTLALSTMNFPSFGWRHACTQPALAPALKSLDVFPSQAAAATLAEDVGDGVEPSHQHALLFGAEAHVHPANPPRAKSSQLSCCGAIRAKSGARVGEEECSAVAALERLRKKMGARPSKPVLRTIGGLRH